MSRQEDATTAFALERRRSARWRRAALAQTISAPVLGGVMGGSLDMAILVTVTLSVVALVLFGVLSLFRL